MTFKDATEITLSIFRDLNVSLISSDVKNETNIIYNLNVFKVCEKNIVYLYNIVDNIHCFVKDEIILSTSLCPLNKEKLSIPYKELNMREFSFLIDMYKKRNRAASK